MSRFLSRLLWFLAWLALSIGVFAFGLWLGHQIDPWLAGYSTAVLWYIAQRSYLETLAQHEEYRMTRGLVLPYWRRRHRWEGGGR